jgi:hypothetical protein
MVGVLISFVVLGIQGAQGPSQAELDAMKKLDFLVGLWDGEGRMSMPGAPAEVFKGGETVQRKLHGKALLIEGSFKDGEGVVVHETLAVVTYDAATKKYTVQTYLFNRPGGAFDLEVQPDGFSWTIDPKNGTLIKYAMKLTGDTWVETGTVEIPNREPIEFLKMTLKKRK